MRYPTDRFRQYYREEIIPNHYSGLFHLGLNGLMLMGTITILLMQLQGWSLANLWVLPVMAVIGSLTVYLLHRYPLHRPIPGMTMAYKIHSLQHHVFFTHESVTWDRTRDFHIVFFPVLVVAGFCFAAVPLIYLGLAQILDPNTAILAAATGAAYFLAYEIVHFCSHLPDKHWLLRNSQYLRKMRDHHRLHHNPEYMEKANFNIVLPLWDYIFRTRVQLPNHHDVKTKD